MPRFNCNYAKFKYFRGLKNNNDFYRESKLFYSLFYGYPIMNNSIYNFTSK